MGLGSLLGQWEPGGGVESGWARTSQEGRASHFLFVYSDLSRGDRSFGLADDIPVVYDHFSFTSFSKQWPQ